MANHVVNSLKFEIKVATKSNFDEISEEIPHLTKTGIAELIDQILSELYPSTNLLVIDKLEIDLGSLRLTHLKADLLKKFQGEFKIAIKEHLESSSPQFTSAGELPFIILDDYIRGGIRPKWLSASEGSFQEHLMIAFSKNPKKFTKQVNGYLKNPTHKKRVLENFPEDVLVQSTLVDNQYKKIDSNEEISRLKIFFREQYRHLDAQSVSVMFKSLLLDLLMNPQRINQQPSFRSAVLLALENRFGAEVASSYQLRMPNSSNPILQEQVRSTRKETKEGTRPLLGSAVAKEELLEKFQFFLMHGHILADSRSSSYRYRNINTLFNALLVQDWDGLVAFLLTYGKSQVVKKRFLDSLSQEAILAFFSKVAPQKRKLLEWVVDVFEQVQEVYKPINQTVIQVKKSINEITFELFLNKNLQSTSDENYLRLLFKKTALKYGISYKNLLFLTLKSISTGDKKYRIFNFNQTLGGLYAKDILKRKGYTPLDLLLFSTDEKEQEWSTNYQNKEELVSLFGGLYQDQYGSLPAAVVAWLQTKLQTLPLTNASRLFELWEEFSEKYTLPLGEFVIPLLLEKKSNARVKLNSAEFNFWVKKYGIQGIYPTKEVDVLQLLTYLQSNKKMVSAAMIKKIALSLPVTEAISKQVFFKVAELIRPRLTAILPEYLEWIQQLLKKNKAEKLEVKLYTWLYHQLITLPQSQLSLASLKEKVDEFLSLSDHGIPVEDEASSLALTMSLGQKELIQQLLKKNKAEALEEKLFAWLYPRLSSLSESQLSNAFLQERVDEFLSLSDHGIPVEDEASSLASTMSLAQKELIQQLLKKNKAEALEEKLFTWLYPRLFSLPESKLSNSFLQEKVEEFLRLNEKGMPAEKEESGSLAARMPAVQKEWIQQLLKKNKAEALEEKLYAWLYPRLFSLPESKLSNSFLQEKVEEFLRLNEKGMPAEKEESGSLAARMPADQKEWIQQLLKKNKAEALEEKLFTWLYPRLFSLPESKLSNSFLQEKVEEFLKMNEQSMPREEKKAVPSVSNVPSVQKRKQSSNSAKLVARLFGILGLEEVYGIFSEAKKYNEEILLKLLTTKYAKVFYQLILTHRYNPEFQDAVLVQAPNWLKKQVLDFLVQRSSFDWNASISALTSYFEETKWVKLEGVALESFIEKILWKEIFEGGSYVRDEVVVELLGNALDARFISAKFWKDLQGYVKKRELQKDSVGIKSFSSFTSLEQVDGFSYLVARGGFKKEEPSILPILESLVYFSSFPVAHTFEGSFSEEFNDYITRLATENKNEFLTFFDKVKYPILSRRFFNLVNYKGLLVLIKEKHRKERIAISVEQVERILKIFTVQDSGKIEIFLRAWLVFLFHSTTRTRSAGYLATAVVDILAEEGLWDNRKVDLEATYDSLAKLLSWKEAEKKYFFNQARGWALVEIIPAPILELETNEQIKAYFNLVNDPYLRDLNGKTFLKIWFKLFFDVASTGSVATFLEIFKNSFFRNSYSLGKQQELFFKGILQLKEGYTSFQQALVDSSQGWIEFRKDSPTFFEQYDQDVAPQPLKMSFVDLLNFYLAYGVLPKEEGSLQAFVKKLVGKNGAELVQIRGIVLSSLLNAKKKKILFNLLRYVDEKWFYDLLHPKLSKELDKLVEEVKSKTGSNFFADLRIQHPVDRILFFAESLSKGGAASKHLVALLLPVFELWVDRKSPSVVAAVFTGRDEKAEVLVLIQHASRKVKKVLEEQDEKKEAEEQPLLIEAEEVNLGEGVSISNAGMILCWPFFGRFFAALGLVEQGKFKGQKSEERAVQLLQYLATGLTSFEEWDLSLNKILCGVPLNTPISPSFEVTVEEDELVRKLINGTIFNWEKMRGTKLETFRETFLTRQGMLYEKDNRWELIVERKAYDVLMDTMNWNISMISLGWMKKRLNVQWR